MREAMADSAEKKDSLTLDAVRRILERTPSRPLAGWPKKALRGADVAVLFNRLTDEERVRIFSLVCESDTGLAAELLSYLSRGIERDLLENIPPEKVAVLVDELSDDDAASLFSILPEERSREVFLHLARAQARRIERLLRYPPDSAGRRMISEFVVLPAETLARDAIEHLRGLKEEEEMVYYLYVADESRRLRGVLSMRGLLLADPNARLGDIMSADVIKIGAHEDQEEAARLVTQYGLMAIPVVDRDDTLLGIITVDDIIDVVEEEATEDIMRMAGTSEDALLTSSTAASLRHRMPWLMATFGGGIVISFLIGRFESVIQQVAIAAAFIPIIAGMGGSVGMQSATIVIRGLALGHVSSVRLGRVLWRELRVTGVMGILYGALLGAFAYFFQSPHSLLGAVVGAALCISVLLAGLLGAFFPLLFHRLGVDPAVATGPFVMTVVDFLSIAAYFVLLGAFLLSPLA
jgi:magnesium transporter